MVLHTHASYPIGHVVTGRFWLDLRPDDLHLNLSETGWAKAAWSSFLGPWNMGAALFVQDARGKFNAPETMQLLEDYPITTFCAPPTAYRMLVLEDLSHYKTNLRHCVGAGEPLNPEVIATWERGTGHLIRDGYGQTETVLLCGNFPSLEVKPGSMGKPSPTASTSRSSTTKATSCPTTARATSPSVSSRSARSGCSRSTGATPRRPRNVIAAIGTSPATARRSTTTATSGSWAARTT